MKKKLNLIAAAVLALAASSANAVLICDACTYIGGQPATNLGDHNPTTNDNSTFANSTTGQNGDFSNWWVFNIASLGAATLNGIFLPIANISNFDVQLFDVTSFTCGGSGAACTELTVGGLLADGTTVPNYASVIDFITLEAGTYALNITGTISGLGEGQPASYAGNLQVAAIPEPETYALFGAGLAALAFLRSRRKNKQA